MSDNAEEPVPKLPRGRGLKLSGAEILRIVLLLFTLVAVIVFTKPCAHAVSSFVTSFGSGKAASSTMPKPGNVDTPREQQYEHLKPGMSEQEVKEAVERAKARAAGSAAAPTPR